MTLELLDEALAREVEASLEALDRSGTQARPVATRISPAATFWPAEEYHQRYLKKQGRGSCHIGG